MGYSKRQFVAAAFEEIGLASYVFDLQTEQLQSAMRRIDAMMADWNGKGIRLGYPLPGSPQDSDLDELYRVYANTLDGMQGMSRVYFKDDREHLLSRLIIINNEFRERENGN